MRKQLYGNLRDQWQRIERCISNFAHFKDCAIDLAECIQYLSAAYEHYQRLIAKLIRFAKDSNIEGFLTESSKIEAVNIQILQLVQEAKDKVELCIAVYRIPSLCHVP